MTETVAISCKDCYSRTQGYPCIYDVTCSICREALLLAQPCKIIRKDMAESLEKRWGPVGDWKREPHCDCDKQCELLQKKREAHENLKAKELQNFLKRRK
jgi:hypothetical protein